MQNQPSRLLLVDEDANLCTALGNYLRDQCGHLIDLAPSASAAISHLASSPSSYDMALIALSLAGRPDGLEVQRYIKLNSPDIDVILFLERDHEQTLEESATDDFLCITKPINFEELSRLIQRTVEVRYLRNTEHEKQVLEQLMKTSTMLLGNPEEPEILKHILESIHALGFDRVRLYLLSADGSFMQGKAQVGMSEDFLETRWPLLDDHYMQILLKDPHSYVFQRLEGTPVPFEDILSKEGVMEWACIPLVIDGRVIGKLSVDRKFHPRPITTEELRPIALFVSQVAIALETARLFRETRRRADELETLRQTTLAITSPLDHTATLETVLQQAVQLLSARSGGIDEFSPEQNNLIVVAEYGRTKTNVGNILGPKDGIAGALISGQDPYIIIDDYLKWHNQVKTYQDREYRAVLAAPLIWQERRIGVIYVDDELGRKFSAEDAKLLSMFASQAAIAIVHSKAIRDLGIAEDGLNKLIANSFDGIIAVDMQGRVTKFNATAERILGYHESEVLGKSVEELYHNPAESHRIGQLLKQAVDGKLRDFETLARNKQGDNIPVRMSASWILDAAGNRVGSVGYFTDLRPVKEPEMHRQMLLDASNAVAQAENLEDGLQSLAQIMTRSCTATFCCILLFANADQDLVIKAAYPLPRQEILSWNPGLGTICRPSRQPDTAQVLRASAPLLLRADQPSDVAILKHLTEIMHLPFAISSSLIIPLRAGTKNLGICILGEMRNWSRNPVSTRKIELATSLTAQAAVLIEKMQLHLLTQRRAEILDAVQKLALTVSSTLDLDEILSRACQAAVALFGADHSGLVIFDSNFERGRVAAEFPKTLGTVGTEIPVLGNPLEESLVATREPIVIFDVEQESRLGSVREIMFQRFNIHSTVFVPVIIKDKLIGTFSLDAIGRKYPFGHEEIELCQIFASHLASAIENARLHQETERRRRLLEALDESSRYIRAEEHPEKLLHEVVQLSTRLMNCSAGGLFINHPHIKQLVLVVANGLTETPLGVRLPYEKGLIGLVARSGNAIAVDHFHANSECEAIFKPYGFETAVAIPLKRAGTVEAVLFIADQSGAWQCTPEDVNILNRFAAQASIALHTSRLMGKEQRQFSQLAILNRISDYVQEARALDKIFHVILTGVTAGYGLGFNRAALLLLNEAGTQLTGILGIGHFNEADAIKDWKSYYDSGMDDFGQYLAALDQSAVLPTPVGERLHGLIIPAEEDPLNLFWEVIREQQWKLVGQKDVGYLPRNFIDAFDPALPLVLVPIVARGRTIGLLVADNKFTQSPVTTVELDLLLTLSNTAAVAIENAQLFDQAMAAQAKIRSSFETSNSLVLSQTTTSVMQDIITKTQQAARASWVSVVLIDEISQARNLFTSGSETKADLGDIIRPNGISHEVMRTGKVVVIEDTSKQIDRVNPRMIQTQVAAALCLPFSVQGRQIGVVWIHYREAQQFPMHEVESLQFFVNQAAIAYDSAHRIEELEHMRQAAEELAKGRGLPETLEKIVTSAHQVLEADSASIWSYDDARHSFNNQGAIAAGIPADLWQQIQNDSQPLGETAFRVIEQGWFGVTDMTEAAQYAALDMNSRAFLDSLGAKSFQGIAISAGAEKLGVLYVIYRYPRSFSQEDQDVARVFANHAALALANARLLEQLNQARDNARLVAEMTSLGELSVTLDSIAAGILSVVGSDIVTLYRYDQEQDQFYFPPTMLGVENEQQTLSFGSVSKDSAPYKVIGLDDLYVTEDTAQDPVLGTRFSKRERVRSSAAVPLIARQRRLGVMFVNFRDFHRFTRDELTNIRLFAHQAAVAISNTELYQQVSRNLDELKQAYGELEQSKSRIGSLEAVTWMGIVSATWRHNVGNNITIIEDLVKLIRKDMQQGRLSEKIAERLKIIEEITAELQSIPMHPLSAEEDVVSVPINQLLRDRIRQFEKKDRYKTINFAPDFKAVNTASVRASPEWLRRVLDILIDNATRAMEEARIKQLTVSTCIQASWLEIAVSDTGSGIPEHIRDRLFREAFKKQKGERGSGVGLLLGRSIIQAYGGTLDVGSSGPEGTTMLIRLPLEQMPLGQSEKVILINNRNDMAWQQVLETALAPEDSLQVYSDSELTNGLKEEPITLIVIDEESVEDVTRLITQLRAMLPDTKIVVASASPTWKNTRDVIRAGAAWFIRKSSEVKELQLDLRKVLGKH